MRGLAAAMQRGRAARLIAAISIPLVVGSPPCNSTQCSDWLDSATPTTGAAVLMRKVATGDLLVSKEVPAFVIAESLCVAETMDPKFGAVQGHP